MSDDPLYEQLRESSWRRKLTPVEESRLSQWLAAHPERQAEWESEAGLNEMLTALPNVPVASNFTSRVVDAAEREAASARRDVGRSNRLAAWWLRWVPKAALALVVCGAALGSYHHFQVTRRAELAQSLATVSQVRSMPGPDTLKDFDAIAALTSTPPADEELLRLMQ
jgi:hypothetical protein